MFRYVVRIYPTHSPPQTKDSLSKVGMPLNPINPMMMNRVAITAVAMSQKICCLFINNPIAEGQDVGEGSCG
jgi:hypothetical protein